MNCSHFDASSQLLLIETACGPQVRAKPIFKLNIVFFTVDFWTQLSAYDAEVYRCGTIMLANPRNIRICIYVYIYIYIQIDKYSYIRYRFLSLCHQSIPFESLCHRVINYLCEVKFLWCKRPLQFTSNLEGYV